MQPRIRKSNDGFTIIELMVVIAIVGILGTIAISNFISHRNKAFCTAAEKDAQTIAAGIADYFAIPSNQTVSEASLQGGNATGNIYAATLLSGYNTWIIDTSDIDTIQISVADVSGRCPADYQVAITAVVNPTGYWSGNTYIKLMGR